MTKKIRNTGFRVQPNAQLSLLNAHQPRTQTTPNQRSLAGFVDPDPDELFFNLMPLREFLISMDMVWVIELRTFIRSLDFTEIHHAYNLTGRAPYAPEAMLALVLYGIMRGSNSLRELELLARSDLGAIWMTGGICPDHSIIGRFLNRHKENLSDEFFVQLTAKIVEDCQIRPQFFAGDGTTIQAAASRYKSITIEAARMVQAETVERIDALNEELSKPLDQATQQKKKDELAEELEEKKAIERIIQIGESRIDPTRQNPEKRAISLRISISEPEACNMKMKEGHFCQAYVGSILTCNSRLIHGQHVDSSNELHAILPMLEHAESINQELAGPLLLDANYCRHEVAKTALNKDIPLYCPSPQQTREARENTPAEKFNRPKKVNLFDKSKFTYNPDGDVIICPANQVMKPGTLQSRDGNRPYIAYRAGKPQCDNCLLRHACTTAINGRVIKRYQDDKHLEDLRKVMEQSEAQTIYSHRQGSVEPVFGTIKNTLKLRRFRRRGLSAVRMEFSLFAMAHNLRRKVILEA